MVRNGRLLDTPYRRGDEKRYYSSFGSDGHHDRHHYHPYKGNDKGYVLDEFITPSSHIYLSNQPTRVNM